MALKISSSQILSCIVGLFIVLLLALLVYSIKLMNSRYDEYKLRVIMNSPYESTARIIDKYGLGGGFEIEYQFKGKPYGEVMRVKGNTYRQYKTGDKIPITISRNNPSLVSLTTELNVYKKENHL
ncbi:MAG TPA: hypothetical protein VGE24_07055 [Emticicia sp.]